MGSGIKTRRSELKKLVDERGVKDLAGVQELMKKLTSGLVQEIMDARWKRKLRTARMTKKTSRQKTREKVTAKRQSPAAKAKLS